MTWFTDTVDVKQLQGIPVSGYQIQVSCLGDFTVYTDAGSGYLRITAKIIFGNKAIT